MTIRQAITSILAAAVFFSCLFPLSTYATSSTASASASSYVGKWVDKALVENEEIDGVIVIEMDKKTDTVNLKYEIIDWDAPTIESVTPIVIDGQKPVKFTYEYDAYNEDGKVYKALGEGTIHFKSGLILLQLGTLPDYVNPIFMQKRSFIRDPYEGKERKPGDDLKVLSKVCGCKESALVKFDYPVADNEGSKNWISYVSVFVRGVFITEYKINLHTKTAINMKDSWSNAYKSYKEFKVSTITATSTLAKSKAASYTTNQLIDGDTASCWCEGVKGNGVGQSFTIQFAKPVEITTLDILPGYGKSVSSYLENNSVRKARITFSNGTSMIADFTKDTEFSLPLPIKATSLTFQILEVVPGTKFSDTCVSELGIT
ncbi:discoidin domain-containing protein [Paenibacillus sp. sgz500958]|uniref:discoidin domain-containing protein n=1 Tax=Paenibacillus sp. sgz500958 TaxID=3242475 RepID=UPI0036D2F6A5